MESLEQILIDANSTLDLEAELPTGTELTLRVNYADQAVKDAAATGQFGEFKKVYEVNTSTLATLSLPNDFREFQTNPRILDDTGAWVEFDVIEPDEKYDYAASDRYCYVLGNPSEGYKLYINQVISMATLSLVYQRYPSGLATLADKCELPDPGYVVRKVESYVLYSRSDDRFPQANALAEQRLQNMYGREMKGSGGQVRTAKSTFRNPLS